MKGQRFADSPDVQCNVTCFLEVYRKTICKTVTGGGTKESILKATVAASAQVSKFCFHRAIPGIKLSYHVQDKNKLEAYKNPISHSERFWKGITIYIGYDLCPETKHCLLLKYQLLKTL
jgi:hypothetical protein